MSSVVFSFCIYGNQRKYCFGLYENLLIIQDKFSDAKIFIYVSGQNVPDTYIELYESFPNTKLFFNPSQENMVDRFFALDDADPEIDIMIVRDADSRIHQRDIWCINDFIKSDFICHTIRDHAGHHRPIMGGLWGLKRKYLYKHYYSLRNLHSLYSQQFKEQYKNITYFYSNLGDLI